MASIVAYFRQAAILLFDTTSLNCLHFFNIGQGVGLRLLDLITTALKRFEFELLMHFDQTLFERLSNEIRDDGLDFEIEIEELA